MDRHFVISPIIFAMEHSVNYFERYEVALKDPVEAMNLNDIIDDVKLQICTVTNT